MTVSAKLTAAAGLTLVLIVLDFVLATPPIMGDPNGKLVGLFAGLVMLAIICDAFAPYLRPLTADPKSGLTPALITLAVLALVKIVLVPHFMGFPVDIALYTSWALRVASLGPAHTYEPGYFLDYPPGYLYALWLAGVIVQAFRASGAVLRTIIESPPLLADFALATLVFALVRRQRSRAIAFAAMLMIAFNPALLWDTLIWGQSDSVPTLVMLLSVAALLIDMPELCFALAAIAVLVKPQGLMLLPVLGLWTLRHFDYRVWLRCAAAFLAAAFIGIAPFQIGHPFNWIFDLYASTAAYYHETSVNAFNLMALLGGLRMPDSTTVFGVSCYRIGMTLLIPLYAYVAWIIWGEHSPRRLLFASFITVFGFFMLAPRMHERYVYAAVAFAAPLAFDAPVMTAVFAILTLTGLFNIACVLRTLQIVTNVPYTVATLDLHDGLAMATAAINLVALGMAVYFGVRARFGARSLPLGSADE